MQRGQRWAGSWDVTLACTLAALGLLEIWLPLESSTGSGSPVAATVGVVLFCAALTQRRARPPWTLLALLVWPLLYVLTGDTLVLFFGQLVPLMVLTYSFARHAPRRWGWVGVLAPALLVLLADLTIAELQAPEELVFHWASLALCWAIGRNLRVSTERAAAAAARAAVAESESRARTAAALAEERARIARELHDVVAHAVSVIVVQAGAAELVVDDDPQQARQSLATIRSTGAGALAEMRRVVTMLRVDEVGAPAPQPGVDALPALVAASITDELSVDLQIEGEARTLPAGLGLAAYRVVQEALTNVRRHARASSATVRLRYGPEHLEIRVVDDGHGGVESTSHEPGHGLIGMRERVGLYGGSLETGGTADGYTVHAVLPVTP